MAVPPIPMALDRIGDSTVCSETLRIGTGDVDDIGEGGVREKVRKEVRVSYQVLMNV